MVWSNKFKTSHLTFRECVSAMQKPEVNHVGMTVSTVYENSILLMGQNFGRYAQRDHQQQFGRTFSGGKQRGRSETAFMAMVELLLQSPKNPDI